MMDKIIKAILIIAVALAGIVLLAINLYDYIRGSKLAKEILSIISGGLVAGIVGYLVFGPVMAAIQAVLGMAFVFGWIIKRGFDQEIIDHCRWWMGNFQIKDILKPEL